MPAAAPARFSKVPGRSKVPQITALFWAIKLLTTGMGEAAADWMAGISIPLAAGVGVLGFIAGMVLQFRAKEYRAGIYWFAVTMVAVFGTMAADGPHIVLDLSYELTAALYIAALALILFVWHRTEGTLSIHSINTPRREAFYWLTVLATFALGTALGDLTAVNWHLGFFASALMFGAAILVPLLGRKFLKWNEVASFWAAYILTRPLGASVADWLGKPAWESGLNWGDGTVTLIFTLLIVSLVIYLARTRKDVQEEARQSASCNAP